jgi:peptidoglycan/LPS O-acetylase OafA/YrhL
MLLLREWSRTSHVDLRTFYLRRALRLGPALVFMLVITIPLIFTALRHTVHVPPWIAILGVLAYVANWVNVVVPGGTGPITHTWSFSWFVIERPALRLKDRLGRRTTVVQRLGLGEHGHGGGTVPQAGRA